LLYSSKRKLRDEWTSRDWQQGNPPKRKREIKDRDVEEALSLWFSIVTGRGVRVSCPVLKSKTEELAKKLGHKDFKATDGWLSRQKTGLGYNSRRHTGRRAVLML
jgi:hypothetical protein